MSGISSGIGLISGINTAQLIEQLMAIEARPVNQLRQRVSALDATKTAFSALTARLLAMKNSGAQFKSATFFQAFTAASSNEGVITAVAQHGATPGTFTFRVHALATNHQLVSRGYADADVTPVGAGRITLEGVKAKVAPATELAALNGGNGVRRGMIGITDRSGTSAEIDLSFAQTIDDVVAAINAADGINVRARVTSLDENGASGDRIVVEDLTGGGDSNLIIKDVGGGHAAEDLGIVADVAAARVDGRDLVLLTDATRLASLNDDNGVDRFRTGVADDFTFEIDEDGNGEMDRTFGVSLSGNLAQRLNTRLEMLNGGRGVRLGTIRITDRTGKSVEVNLDERENGVPLVQTAADVIAKINDEAAAAGVQVSATVINSHFQVSDTSGAQGEGATNFKIEDVNGSAAADLGIAADVEESSISGREVYRIETLGDVIRAINLAEGNDGAVVARIREDGNGITLETDGFRRQVRVVAGTDGAATSNAAADLGILTDQPFDAANPLVTRDLAAGLGTVLLRSLNGGTGVEQLGMIRLVDRAGNETQADLSGAATLADVIDGINAAARDAGVALVAAVNETGNGIAVTDESGGQGNVIIADRPGSTVARDLHVAGDFAPGQAVSSGNLQRQYVARATRLADLLDGQAFIGGEVRVTAADGTTRNFTLSDNVTTVGDVIDRINLAGGDKFTARINDTGDGILIEDTSAGPGALKVEDERGGTAADQLRIAGATEPGAETKSIDGTFEIRVEIDANDALNDIRDKINAAGGAFNAAVVNAGGVNPFSLTLSAERTGRAGALVIDAGGVDLGLRTLAAAQDALVTLGGGEGRDAVLIASPTNTLDNVIAGVTLNLLDVSDEDVTITVNQDIDGMVQAIRDFVDDYNEIQGAIDDNTRFDPETFQRAILFGDATVNTVRNRLHGLITRRFEGASDAFSRLSAVGLNTGANNRLEFDEERFREAYQENPEQVEQLFTQADTGFGAMLDTTLDGLTDDADGIVSRKNELLDNQKDLLNDRIDLLNVLLDRKRTRLERQFIGLESSLAELQRQQNALIQLQILAGA